MRPLVAAVLLLTVMAPVSPAGSETPGRGADPESDWTDVGFRDVAGGVFDDEFQAPHP